MIADALSKMNAYPQVQTLNIVVQLSQLIAEESFEK